MGMAFAEATSPTGTPLPGRWPSNLPDRLAVAPGEQDNKAVTGKQITLVHLAVDYNTPQRKPTTNAIERFVEELTEFNNVVVALKRSVSLRLEAPVPGETITGRVYHFPYFGLPLGLDLRSAMRTAARRVIQQLETDGIRPDLVHAHKLTFEGLAGWYVARHFGVPLLVSLRGEVETKVFRMKPELRGFLRRVAADAAKHYFVSAWFREEFNRYVPLQSAKERLLPNIVENIAPTIVPQAAGDAFVTVFNLDTWKRKGLRWLLDAFALALKQDQTLRLDIIGGGSIKNVALIEKMIAVRGLQHAVSLLGPMPNAMLLSRLPTYRGLLLPSLNETFGMVYVEALFAGIPVLLTANSAVDGYLDGLNVAFAVPPKDVGAISAAILQMSANNAILRKNIVAAAPTLFARFSPGESVKSYCNDVRNAVLSLQVVK